VQYLASEDLRLLLPDRPMKVRVTFKTVEMYFDTSHFVEPPTQSELQAIVNESGFLEANGLPEIEEVRVLEP
jgi:hypothetical protein